MTDNSQFKNDSGTCSLCKATYSLNDIQKQAVERGLNLGFIDKSGLLRDENIIHVNECQTNFVIDESIDITQIFKRLAVIQIVECLTAGCPGIIVIESKINSPAIDMANLWLVPARLSHINSSEQAWILKNQEQWHRFLKFKNVYAWDEPNVDEYEFMTHFYPASISSLMSIQSYKDAPLILSENEFKSRLQQEKNAGEVKLRRLLPDTPYFRNLLTLLAPNKIRELMDGGSIVDGLADDDYEVRGIWLSLIEEAEGQTFEQAFKDRLVSNDIVPPDPS